MFVALGKDYIQDQNIKRRKAIKSNQTASNEESPFFYCIIYFILYTVTRI